MGVRHGRRHQRQSRGREAGLPAGLAAAGLPDQHGQIRQAGRMTHHELIIHRSAAVEVGVLQAPRPPLRCASPTKQLAHSRLIVGSFLGGTCSHTALQVPTSACSEQCKMLHGPCSKPRQEWESTRTPSATENGNAGTAWQSLKWYFGWRCGSHGAARTYHISVIN
jgi:hypothetical protein